MAFSRPLKRHRDDAADMDDSSWHCVQCGQANGGGLGKCFFCTTDKDAYRQLQIKLIVDHPLADLVRLPSHWNCNPSELFVNLREEDLEFSEVQNAIASSGLKWKKATTVRRIENPLLFRAYLLQKHDLTQRLGLQLNEKKLFHGAALETLEKIAQEGFNLNFAAEDGVYGKAAYVAVQAGVSAWLRYARRDRSGIQHILCCLVLTGNCIKGQIGWLEPPKLPSHIGLGYYDSVTDNESQPTLYGIFNTARIYPTHIVSLVKKEK